MTEGISSFDLDQYIQGVQCALRDWEAGQNFASYSHAATDSFRDGYSFAISFKLVRPRSCKFQRAMPTCH